MSTRHSFYRPMIWRNRRLGYTQNRPAVKEIRIESAAIVMGGIQGLSIESPSDSRLRGRKRESLGDSIDKPCIPPITIAADSMRISFTAGLFCVYPSRLFRQIIGR